MVAAVGLLAGCENSVDTQLKVQVGQTFPELDLVDLHGKPVSLKSFAGKPLVINVWATWCAPCRKELPSLQKLQKTLAADGVVVLGMSVDDDDHLVREFLIDRQVKFTSYMDPAMAVANDVLGVRVYPSTFLLDKQGRLKEVIEGEREWHGADMVKHIREAIL